MATATAPATDTHHDAHDPHATNTGISNNKLAMWLFLSTDWKSVEANCCYGCTK